MAITVMTSGRAGSSGDYLPLTGGILTGYLQILTHDTSTGLYIEDTTADKSDSAGVAIEVQATGSSTATLEIHNVGNVSHTQWKHSNTYNSLEITAPRSGIVLKSTNTNSNLSIVNNGSTKIISGLTNPTGNLYAANKQYVDRAGNGFWAFTDGNTSFFGGISTLISVDTTNKWQISVKYNNTSSYDTPTIGFLKISAGFTPTNNSMYTMTIKQSGGGMADATPLIVKANGQGSAYGMTIVDLANVTNETIPVIFTASFDSTTNITQPFMIIEAMEWYM